MRADAGGRHRGGGSRRDPDPTSQNRGGRPTYFSARKSIKNENKTVFQRKFGRR